MSERESLLSAIIDLQAEVRRLNLKVERLEARLENSDKYVLVEDCSGQEPVVDSVPGGGKAAVVGSSQAVPASDPAGANLPLASPGPSAELPGNLGQTPSDLLREEAARETGRFFARCLTGLPRGNSGRQKIRLQNNFYVVIREFNGKLHTSPAKVFSQFNLCRTLVAQGGRGTNYGDSIFAGFCAKIAVEEAGFEWPAEINW